MATADNEIWSDRVASAEEGRRECTSVGGNRTLSGVYQTVYIDHTIV